ncbi:DUF433 domain-containing protein [Lewinella sp. IMCC34191]|uniref:DUF433 domain-containing protein n=1 Tax=Lewinella sp. IMCC34191 TaxID=2259172 RepID=UPI000E235145|nr:DUF433 domain-containing protein [Lewinella sp. IMCC34191]
MADEAQEFTGISINPNVRFGKACIAGTRITVSDILGWLSGGMSEAAIIEDFPELSVDNIREALGYAAARENRGTIIIREKRA